MTKINYSTNFQAIQSRLRRIPKLVDETLDSFAKRDAVRVIQIYQDKLKRDKFDVDRLSDATVKIKSEQGLPQPRTPLYGQGENEPDSLYNALAIRKIKGGYRVYVRWAKHHASDLKLRDLLNIHQRGALIMVTDKMRGFLHYLGIHLRADTVIIRIPPRPILDMAIVAALKMRRKEDPAKIIREAMAEIIKTGKENIFKKYRDFNEREAAKYE